MNLQKPVHEDIVQGNEVDIINREGEKIGRAILIARCPSRYTQDGLPYVMTEKQNEVYNDTLHIWSFERWQVSWTEHKYYRLGDRNCTEVHFYIKSATNYPSFFSYYGDVSREISATGKFIFLEEDGVLISSEASYPEESITALNRICKSFGGSLVVYGHNQSQIRETFKSKGIKRRILSFLDTTLSFEEAIQVYLESQTDVEDYMVLCGTSTVHLKQGVIRVDPNKGLQLKKRRK